MQPPAKLAEETKASILPVTLQEEESKAAARPSGNSCIWSAGRERAGNAIERSNAARHWLRHGSVPSGKVGAEEAVRGREVRQDSLLLHRPVGNIITSSILLRVVCIGQLLNWIGVERAIESLAMDMRFPIDST